MQLNSQLPAFQGSVSGTGGGHFNAKTNGNLAPVATLIASPKGLNAMALSPDGSRIATAGRDGVVRVHDLGNGALLTGFRVRAPYGQYACKLILGCFHICKRGPNRLGTSDSMNIRLHLPACQGKHFPLSMCLLACLRRHTTATL